MRNKISILNAAKKLAPTPIKRLDLFRHFDSDSLLRFLTQFYKLCRIVDILIQDTTAIVDTKDYLDIQKDGKRCLVRIVPDWVNSSIILWLHVEVPDTLLEIPVRITKFNDEEDIETFFATLKGVCGIDIPMTTESTELSVYINSLEDYLMSQAEELYRRNLISMGFITYRHYYLINIFLMLKRELGSLIDEISYNIGVVYLTTQRCELSVSYSWVGIIPDHRILELKKVPDSKEWRKIIYLIKILNKNR